MGELRNLARTNATGVLRIEGSPSGAIYLDGGRVTFCESSGAPGIGVRLAGSRRLSESQWRMLLADRPPSKAGDLLVEQGLITREDLRTVLRSAVLDAIIALTLPAVATPAPPISSRFVPRQRHWAAALIHLDVETVHGEITRSASRPAQQRVRAGARPKLSDVRRTSAVVNREQWIVACRIDGRTSVWDLAWRNGFALSDTSERVGELVTAGLCTLVESGETGAAAAPGQVAPPARPALSPGRALPRRHRGAALPDKVAARLLSPDGTGPPAAPVHPDLLRRLLDGLRRME
jgi:uncharacterized protein DUF4388